MSEDPRAKEFNDNVLIITTNLRDTLDEMQNAWIAYTAVVSAPRVTGADVLGAFKTAVSLIPGVGSILGTAIELGGTANGLYDAATDSSGSNASGTARYMRQVKDTVNLKIDWYNRAKDVYSRASSSERDLIEKKAFPGPIKPLTTMDKNKIAYAIEYGLFERYVRGRVVVGRIYGRSLTGIQRGPWSVWEGLEDDEQAHIFSRFGGGEYFNRAKAAGHFGRYLKASVKGDFVGAMRAGMQLLGTKLKPIKDPESLIRWWGAKRKEFDNTSVANHLLVAGARGLARGMAPGAPSSRAFR